MCDEIDIILQLYNSHSVGNVAIYFNMYLIATIKCIGNIHRALVSVNGDMIIYNLIMFTSTIYTIKLCV